MTRLKLPLCEGCQCLTGIAHVASPPGRGSSASNRSLSFQDQDTDSTPLSENRLTPIELPVIEERRNTTKTAVIKETNGHRPPTMEDVWDMIPINPPPSEEQQPTLDDFWKTIKETDVILDKWKWDRRGDPIKEPVGNIVAIGLPGKGKSTVLTTIATGNPNDDVFPSGRSASAFTKSVSVKEVEVEAPGEGKLPLRIFDIPGLLDGSIKVEEWKSMLKEKLPGVPIDLILVVVSAHDRVDIGNLMIAVALPFFFTEFDINRVCLVMTHMDQLANDTEETSEADQVRLDYIKEWKTEIEKCAKRPLSGTFLRFDRKRAVEGRLGFHGKLAHSDEIRLDVLAVLRDSVRCRTSGVNEPLEAKAMYREPDGPKLYEKLAETIDPAALEKVGVRRDCCFLQ